MVCGTGPAANSSVHPIQFLTRWPRVIGNRLGIPGPAADDDDGWHTKETAMIVLSETLNRSITVMSTGLPVSGTRPA